MFRGRDRRVDGTKLGSGGKQCSNVVAGLGFELSGFRTYRCVACSVWCEAAQQAAEEVHEADWQVDVGCGDHLSAVAPYKGDARVHQPVKQREYLRDNTQKGC